MTALSAKQTQDIFTPVIWLVVVCLMTWLMIVVGGYTRLMHAGLSIVDWKPITGIIPPLSGKHWLLEFEKYKMFPEFQQINSAMTLGEFKIIFLIEYSHRLLGRLLGVFFIIPFLWFLSRGQIKGLLLKRCVVMLLLGCMQGVMGWYMVKSGLVKAPEVSHFRLAAHLLLAFSIVGVGLWTILDMLGWRRQKSIIPWFILLALIVTITYGAFTAGLKAGLIYNTFPKMEAYWLPPEWNFLTPLWHNFIKNHTTIQFMHRFLALSTLVGIGVYAWMTSNKLAKILFAIVLIQVLLGVATLMMQVPVSLGVLHQGWGVVVFVHAIMLCYGGQKKDSLQDLKNC